MEGADGPRPSCRVRRAKCVERSGWGRRVQKRSRGSRPRDKAGAALQSGEQEGRGRMFQLSWSRVNEAGSCEAWKTTAGSR